MLTERKEGKASLLTDLPVTQMLPTAMSAVYDHDFHSNPPSRRSNPRKPKEERIDSLKKWQKFANTVGYIDLAFSGVHLGAIALLFLALGGTTLLVQVMSVMLTHERTARWHLWRSNTLSRSLVEDVLAAWDFLWITWAGVAVFLVVTIVRFWAAKDLINATELSSTATRKDALEALQKITTWRNVAIATVFMDGCLTYVSRPFVIATLLQSASIGIVWKYIEELQVVSGIKRSQIPNKMKTKPRTLSATETNANTNTNNNAVNRQHSCKQLRAPVPPQEDGEGK